MSAVRAGAWLAAAALLLAACGPRTGELTAGSQPTAMNAGASNARFEPKPGDFVSVEFLQVRPDQMKQAAEIFVKQTLPAVKERGGVRDSYFLRDEGRNRLAIFSIWSSAVDFQRWQMSRERIEAYRPLGPLLMAEPAADAAVLVGVTGRGG